jgi:hypothetical protein
MDGIMGRKKKIHWIWILFLGCILFIGPSALAANPNPLPLTAHPSDFVRVEGNHFVLGGQRWYPNGINYFPLNSIRIGETEKPRPNHWFSPGVYDPGAIEADLSLLRGLGMNMEYACLGSSFQSKLLGKLYRFPGTLPEVSIQNISLFGNGRSVRSLI